MKWFKDNIQPYLGTAAVVLVVLLVLNYVRPSLKNVPVLNQL